MPNFWGWVKTESRANIWVKFKQLSQIDWKDGFDSKHWAIFFLSVLGGNQATEFIWSVNKTYFIKLRANTSLSVLIIPVIAENQAEIYIRCMLSNATQCLYQPKVKGNNVIITPSKFSNLYIAAIAESAAGLSRVQQEYVLA